MSKHSIKESTQLRVNGNKVEQLGVKVRLRDAGINLNALMRRVETTGAKAQEIVGGDGLKKASEAAKARRAPSPS